MTSTTAKAASDGTATPVSMPERVAGMARVEDAKAYHLASIAQDAACEAERLCTEIYRAATYAYLPSVSAGDADRLDGAALRDKADEAIRCLTAAESYLRSLTGGEPPF